MKTNRSLLPSLVVAAALLGLGATAHADTSQVVQPAEPVVSQGLLGQVYGTLTYSYVDLDGAATHGDDYQFALNQPLSFGLDGFLSYDYAEFGLGGGFHSYQNIVMAGLRPFSTHYNGGKPSLEAAGGYAWTATAGIHDNSFVWEAAAGAEFQVNPRTTVTPYVQYIDAPDLPGNGTWNFGAKGNYWVTPQWAVTAGVQVDDDNNAGFTVGTNFHF